jgi:cardiolipin synthase A/B
MCSCASATAAGQFVAAERATPGYDRSPMAENTLEMHVDGHRILPALLRDITAATQAVHVSMFLFFRDPIGDELADALCRTAQQGVSVRVLLNMAKTAMGDPFSTGEKEMLRHDPSIDYDPTDVKPLCEKLTAAGVLVRDTNIDYDAVVGGVDARLGSIAAQIRGGIAVDDMHIDHRKIVVIDGRIAWCGGANVGAQYMHHVAFDARRDAKLEAEERRAAKLSEPWWKWHDSLTRVEGPIVTQVDGAFRDRWLLDGGEPYTPKPPAPSSEPPRGHPARHVELFCNEPSAEPNQVRELYVRLIGEARRSIFIENPYLYHPVIVEALCQAKTLRPELDVSLILPAGIHNDSSFSQDAQEHCYERFIACGVRVHEYQNHFTHLKTAVFDERFSIHGSTNLNYRSLEDDKDFELVLLVDSPELARWMLSEVRDRDLACSRAIGAAELKQGFAGLRRRIRDPRTLLLESQRIL